MAARHTLTTPILPKPILSPIDLRQNKRLGRWTHIGCDPSRLVLRSNWAIQRRGQHTTTPRDPIRKIYYAFDPAAIGPDTSSPDSFSFLKPSDTARECLLQNINRVDPPARRVPWPTLLPGSLQSRYWVEAEKTAREFALSMSADSLQDDATRKYLDTAVDASVHFATNLIPAGNLVRTKILAKAYMLFFMHDDAIDSGNYAAAIPNIGQTSLDSQSKHLGYDTVARELLSEDNIQGQRVLEGILRWGSTIQKARPESFPNLEEYMIYRAQDSGAYSIFRTMEFALGVHFPYHESASLKHLRTLCARHFLLVNDLYSYEKELIAETKLGQPLLNAVCEVQNLMSSSASSASSAKGILRQVIYDIERQMNQTYRLIRGEDTTDSQLVYAQGLIAAAAGNLFYSATCARYARVVSGSRLGDA